ncbi:hypothetical protein L686_05780 [Stutzerimonas stutzeri MF28]|nr:hypothetical protein L686_05780 [Stutzerimonas stutzeri MF28]
MTERRAADNYRIAKAGFVKHEGYQLMPFRFWRFMVAAS